MAKEVGCVKRVAQAVTAGLDAHLVDRTYEGDKCWNPIAHRYCIRTRKSYPLHRQRSH